jgi:hypothetical protein
VQQNLTETLQKDPHFFSKVTVVNKTLINGETLKLRKVFTTEESSITVPKCQKM